MPDLDERPDPYAELGGRLPDLPASWYTEPARDALEPPEVERDLVEVVDAKADRLLAAGAVTVIEITGDRTAARVLGDNTEHAYAVTYDPDGWLCTCAERRGRCSHIAAVRKITTAGTAPTVNYDQARQLEDKSGWHWTTMNDHELVAAGYCGTHPPHATADEARGCYRRYCLDHARLDITLGSYNPCEHADCDELTNRAASPGGEMSSTLYRLCDQHRTQQYLEDHLEAPGEIIHS